MKTLLTLSIATLMALPVMADINPENEELNVAPENSENTEAKVNTTQKKHSSWFTRAETNQDEFGPKDNYEEGFVTQYINEAIAKAMKADEKTTDKSGKMKYGRKITDYVSAPKFGGYFMSGYYYSGDERLSSSNEFKIKNARMYVSGTILRDFNYLVQVQLTNDKFHMKDYYLEWKRWKEFQVKGGQFIRVFGYECPYNPFEFYEHSYAQISQKLCGQADRVGQDNGGGRDQGLQIQGDLFPIGKDKHRLIHYQAMVSNGQTINSGDKNSKKDFTGCIAIQPIAGLRFAFWGWIGNFTGTNTAGQEITVDRKRYMISAFYDKNDWTFRAEFAHSYGGKIENPDDKEAQGWYATLGIPCTKWLKTYVKYDTYQDHATTDVQKTLWSITPHISLHKNLYFLPSFAYVHDKTSATTSVNYCEFHIEMGVRF